MRRSSPGECFLDLFRREKIDTLDLASMSKAGVLELPGMFGRSEAEIISLMDEARQQEKLALHRASRLVKTGG